MLSFVRIFSPEWANASYSIKKGIKYVMWAMVLYFPCKSDVYRLKSDSTSDNELANYLMKKY